MIPRLQTKGVYACHCRIKADAIHIGILVINPDFDLEVAELIDPESKQLYKIRVPQTETYFIDIEVPRV